MNIVITLPTKLAHLIYEGTKTIEVRKNFPKHFDPRKDVVYICEKGVGHVTGMFTINAKGVTNSPNLLWDKYAESIAIDKQWLMRYAKGTKKLFLWHIHHADKFQKQYRLEKYFGVKKAPQSYVYTTAEWFLNYSFLIEVKEPQDGQFSVSMCGEKKGGTVVPPSDFQTSNP